jgi:hypothetical protein
MHEEAAGAPARCVFRIANLVIWLAGLRGGPWPHSLSLPTIVYAAPWFLSECVSVPRLGT